MSVRAHFSRWRDTLRPFVERRGIGMSFLKRRYHAPGTSPGTYDTPLTRKVELPDISVVDFAAAGWSEVGGLDALSGAHQFPSRWVRVFGRPNLTVLERLREMVHLDPLLLEDIASEGQRPKLSEVEDHLFVTLSVPDREDGRHFRQLSLYLADDTLVSIYDGDAAFFAPVVHRLEQSETLRERGTAYLFYALMDLAVDSLFPWLEEAGDRLEHLEATILEQPDPGIMADVHSMRRDLLVFRRVAWATREVVGNVLRHFDADAAGRIHLYLQDTQDHIVTIIDIVEVLRDVSTTLVELNMSMMSHRMNDVIKVLTIIATLFIPPTFITGIYGMNFDRSAGPFSMPELGWPLGYLSVLGLMVLLMVGMLVYFKRKRWF